MPAPSPLSSRVIFAFMTAFGGGGAAASVYGLSTLPSVGIGLGSGLVIGGLVYGLTLAVFRQQATSGFEVASLVGKSGRVVITIPAGGTGQVSVAAGGGSSTLLASARDGDGGRHGGPQDLELGGMYLHVARRELRVAHVGRACHHLAFHDDDRLAAEPARSRQHVRWRPPGAEGHLYQPRAVAQVHEHEPTQVAPPVHPAAEPHPLPRMRRA